MNILLKIEMIIISLVVLSLVIIMLKNKNMSIKYSVVWLIIPVVFMMFALFSDPLITFANKIGFELLSNLVFFITFGILFTITFSLTVIVSNLKRRIVELTQEISMLKERK